LVLSQNSAIPQPGFALAHKNVQGVDNNDAKDEQDFPHFYFFMTFIQLIGTIIHKNAKSSTKLRGKLGHF